MNLRNLFALVLACATVAACAGNSFAMQLPTPTNQVTQAVKAQGNSATAGAAVVLDNLVKELAGGSTGNADMDAVITSLNSLSSGTERSKAAEETTPLMSGGQTQAIQSVLEGSSHMVLAHTGEVRGAVQSGLSSGDETPADKGYTFWAKIYGSRADQSASDGAAGYEALSAGLVAGVDTNVTDTDVAGVALGVSHTDIKGSGAATNKAEIYGYQAIVYLSHALDKRTTLDAHNYEESSIRFALKTGFLSFDSTRVSANDVGYPIDVIIYPHNSKELIVKRFEEKDLTEISHLWGDKLTQAVREIPDDWARSIIPNDD